MSVCEISPLAPAYLLLLGALLILVIGPVLSRSTRFWMALASVSAAGLGLLLLILGYHSSIAGICDSQAFQPFMYVEWLDQPALVGVFGQ